MAFFKPPCSVPVLARGGSRKSVPPALNCRIEACYAEVATSSAFVKVKAK